MLALLLSETVPGTSGNTAPLSCQAVKVNTIDTVFV